jgi:glutamate-1-semialdehyde 2,1-aminomutase
MLDVGLQPKTAISQRLLAEATALSPGGVQGDGRWYEPFPLFIKKALGSKIWDVDDNEYIDYWASAGPAILGHNDPRVREAVIDTLQTEGVLFTAPHPKEVQLAKVFAELIPCADKTAFCGGGGSDAMYNAVRVARAYTGRKKILKFEGGYHGWHDDYAASLNPPPQDAGPADSPNTVPMSAGSLEEVTQQIVVAPFNDEAALERIVTREKDNLAAIIVEPVGHSSGVIILKSSFLTLLRQLCDAHGIVLIFDEILTGFRHHLGGAQTLLGVTPDLGVFGKAMANGFPISALAGKRDVMSMFRPEGPVLLSGTFMGHLLSVTASLQTIATLRDATIYSRLWQMGERLSSEINGVIDELNLDARCYSYGPVWCLYFTRRVENLRDIIHLTSVQGGHAKDRAFRTTLLNKGIFIMPGRTNRGYISAAHTDEDIARTIDATVKFLVDNQSDLR